MYVHGFNAACCAALLTLLSCSVSAVEAQADPAARILEDLRAANVARSALATEESDWRVERERLDAVREAIVADSERLERETLEAEAQRKHSETDLTSLGTGSDDFEPIRVALAESAKTMAAKLSELAKKSPPGAVAVPAEAGEAAFDDAVRALDATERAASMVSIEVVPGQLGSQAMAVKVLRVAGACAWWIGLDGVDAGTAAIKDGRLELLKATDEADRRAIVRAFAIAEGRHAAELVVLPTPPTLSKAGP
jgi:hypothetical protein